MATKRIIVKSYQRTKYFTWWDSDGTLKDDSDGNIGKAKSLKDAIDLAKAHTGGSDQRVEIKD